ncbi:PREDICTED: uncharacterized protein LOC106104518 [Papilio polytes]|uniref:uncharacterized protein LOC106104518 n=1 Tax=Papilio polytes TaxID=76194 RepID=UPI000676A7E8|nr:PREDICTED: uncharacterized protein LOC106104518 [Papilio polytes]
MNARVQNTKKCAGCARDMSTPEHLKCNTCSLKYHFECVSTTAKKFKSVSSDFKNSWVCSACRPKLPKADSSISLTRTVGFDTSQDNTTSNVTVRRNKNDTTINTADSLTLENVKAMMQETMDGLLSNMEIRMTKIIEEKYKEIFKEFNEMKESITNLKTEYADMKRENEMLRSTVKDLGNRLNIFEQYSRRSNVEIQCIPEHKTENLINVVTQISKAVGNNLVESDIIKCTRIAKMNPESKRPRSVVVTFSNPRNRDAFLASVMQYNKKHRNDKLNTSHIGYGGDRNPIYVLEHLAPEVKKLHALTREAAKRLNFKFVWIKNSRIFMRKSETSEHITIREADQLKSLT